MLPSGERVRMLAMLVRWSDNYEVRLKRSKWSKTAKQLYDHFVLRSLIDGDLSDRDETPQHPLLLNRMPLTGDAYVLPRDACVDLPNAIPSHTILSSIVSSRLMSCLGMPTPGCGTSFCRPSTGACWRRAWCRIEG